MFCAMKNGAEYQRLKSLKILKRNLIYVSGLPGSLAVKRILNSEAFLQ